MSEGTAPTRWEIRRITASKSDAEVCRENSWNPGTRLVGDEGYGPTVIEITALGEQSILAKSISHNGKPRDEREGLWTLSCREWKKI